MSPQLKDAMRKEAFVQGWIRARAEALGRSLADIDDAERERRASDEVEP